MLREDRFITFNYSDILEALILQGNADLKGLPAQNAIASIKPSEDKKTIHVVVNDQDKNAAKTFDFTQEIFCFSLVLFCQKHAIPIPKIGRKQIAFQENDVVLRIQIERHAADAEEEMKTKNTIKAPQQA